MKKLPPFPEVPADEQTPWVLPAWVDGHFGPKLKATRLYLHPHGRMTQPLLKEMLNACGLDLSTGPIDALLSYGQDGLVQEKTALLQVGLEVSSAMTVDDTGARHPSKNGSTPPLGNDCFAWFESTEQKSRVNCRRWFLDLALRRLYRSRDEWLLVLQRPEVPLHTNGSEPDIRQQVIRKNISGGTRSDGGRPCRDTFLSLKKTCRKLGLSFWYDLLDRIQGDQAIPPGPVLIHQRANSLAG